MCTIPFGDEPDWNDTDSFPSFSPFSVPNKKGDHILCVKKKQLQQIRRKQKDYPE